MQLAGELCASVGSSYFSLVTQLERELLGLNRAVLLGLIVLCWICCESWGSCW